MATIDRLWEFATRNSFLVNDSNNLLLQRLKTDHVYGHSFRQRCWTLGLVSFAVPLLLSGILKSRALFFLTLIPSYQIFQPLIVPDINLPN